MQLSRPRKHNMNIPCVRCSG